MCCCTLIPEEYVYRNFLRSFFGGMGSGNSDLSNTSMCASPHLSIRMHIILSCVGLCIAGHMARTGMWTNRTRVHPGSGALPDASRLVWMGWGLRVMTGPTWQ